MTFRSGPEKPSSYLFMGMTSMLSC